jgi:DNA-binding CsgD family transcriptional regulator
MNKNFWDYPLCKHHQLSDQIRPLITPLFDAFGMSHFSYFFVTPEGHSACLGTNPEWMEFYLYNDLFLHNPFLRSPHLIPEGVFFTQSIKHPGYRESKKHAKNFGIEDSLLLTFKEKGILQGFSFGLSKHDKNYTLFTNEVPLLKRFCKEFEKRAERSLQELEPVDVRQFIGNAFYKKQDWFSLDENKRKNLLVRLNFKVPDLSPREKEALSLYLQGETARSIAKRLNLSSRTVESYLENIKNKLNCYQKTELLKRAQELQDYGLLLP